MLSLERCRTLLGADCTLTDAQIERLRDQIRVVAEVTMNVMMTPNATTPFHEAIHQLPDRDEVEERAAIMEFEGGMIRNRAEKTAVMNVMKEKKR